MMHIYTCLNERTERHFPLPECKKTAAARQSSLIQPDCHAQFDKKCRPSASEIFAKSAIGHHCNCNPESIVIDRDAWGKPHCRFPKNNIHFNLSHSGQWIACAIAAQVIGIDIQQMMPLSPGQQNNVAQKILTEEEQSNGSE